MISKKIELERGLSGTFILVLQATPALAAAAPALAAAKKSHGPMT